MGKSVLLREGVLLLAVVFLLPACKKDNDQELRDQEMRQLQQYLEDNNITQEPTASGLYYILITEGTGTRPEKDFVVDFEYTRELIDGTVFGTSYEDVAKNNNLYNENTLYGPIRLLAGNTGVPGMDEGLMLMKEGGKAKMIMPSSINGYPSTYSTHIYTVNLVAAFNDPGQFETNQIINYLNEHEIDSTSVYITESGLHYIEELPGEGELIKDGDTVEVWYTGTFLDGRVFSSNVGENVMTVDMPADNFIEAWDEALKLMREGGQAKFIVPYKLAYGDNGKDPIPPFMTLVFELEIDSVMPGN